MSIQLESEHGGRIEGDYRSYRALNQSIAKHIVRNPELSRLYWTNQLKRDPTPAQRLGSVVDAWILGGYEPPQIFDGVRRGKKWDEFQQEHAGKRIVNPREAEQEADVLRQINESLFSHDSARKVMQQLVDTHVAIWFDEPSTGVHCKAEVDGITAEQIIDLKTCSDVDRFERDVDRYGYWFQAAWYQTGVERCGGGTLPFRLVAVETAPPYRVEVFDLEDEYVEAGRREMVEACAYFELHHRKTRWLPYDHGEPKLLRCPQWRKPQEENEELTLNGEVLEW